MDIDIFGVVKLVWSLSAPGAAEGDAGGLAARVPGGARPRDAGMGGSLLRTSCGAGWGGCGDGKF